MELFGWLGTILLSCASIPQAIKVAREKHARGMSWAYIALLICGFGNMLAYSAALKAWPLAISYCVQLILFGTMGFIKLKDQ